MNRARRIGIIALSIAVAAILAALYSRHARLYPSTDDAYVDADVVAVVAQVAGPIVNLPIEDNQAVRAGDLLFEIDPRPFLIAVEKAKAELDKTGQNVSALADEVVSAEARVQEARANLRLAQTQWKRIEPLSKLGAVPFQDRDKARAGLDDARSGLAGAQAQLTKARHELGASGEDNADDCAKRSMNEGTLSSRLLTSSGVNPDRSATASINASSTTVQPNAPATRLATSEPPAMN